MTRHFSFCDKEGGPGGEEAKRGRTARQSSDRSGTLKTHTREQSSDRSRTLKTPPTKRILDRSGTLKYHTVLQKRVQTDKEP
jgi:hypothetical protein